MSAIHNCFTCACHYIHNGKLSCRNHPDALACDHARVVNLKDIGTKVDDVCENYYPYDKTKRRNIPRELEEVKKLLLKEDERLESLEKWAKGHVEEGIGIETTINEDPDENHGKVIIFLQYGDDFFDYISMYFDEFYKMVKPYKVLTKQQIMEMA